jgi:hypothetical protein
MAINYAYYYAKINTTTGMCFGLQDSSDYILDPMYVPIEIYNANYLMKYYYPIPETVESFDDFQGQWYKDAAHTILWSPEG